MNAMKKAAFAAFSAALCQTTLAQVPFTFQSGTSTKAAEVNANFQNLDQRIAGTVASLRTEQVVARGESNATANCPANHLIVSVGGLCTNNSESNRNFGVVFSQRTAGNGGVFGCFDFPFDSSRRPAIAEITLVCVALVDEKGNLFTRTAASQAAAKSQQQDIELKAAEDQLHSELSQMRAQQFQRASGR